MLSLSQEMLLEMKKAREIGELGEASRSHQLFVAKVPFSARIHSGSPEVHRHFPIRPILWLKPNKNRETNT